MKCSNPNCNRGIGLVAYGRGWFRRRNYCSRECRDSFVAEGPKQSQQEGSATTNFEWLFLQPIEKRQLLQPIEKRQPKLMPAVVRVRLNAAHCSGALGDGTTLRFSDPKGKFPN
ncbi:MAG TPA: hypothetical protein VGU64_04695 [Terriglobales bacterium]|nr:hypothetical protein [Terriglobales bacterium]